MGRLWLRALLLLAGTGIGAQTNTDQILGRQWWAHVRVLADPALKGRLTGSEEYRKAAGYVVEQLRTFGVKPAGVNGTWYQPVRFDVQRILPEDSALALLDGTREIPLALGDDAVLGVRMRQPQAVQAPLVFLGYGLNLPDANYDDFDSAGLAGSSLRNKIIVVINGGPGNLSGPLKSYARTAPMIRAIRSAGAVGVISIPTPKSMDFGWQRIATSATQPGMRLAPDRADAEVAKRHPALADDHGEMFSATFNPAQAEKLFEGSGHSFAEILALADAQKALPRFRLARSLRAKIATTNTEVESPNIAGVLEGSDPALRSQYVVISAHLDHLGVGAPIHGKTVYPGAMDDASGVATVLETARTLSQGGRPKRSMLFLIFTAEEKGLLGSRYYAGHPSVPEGSIIADLNLDMFMPLFALRKLHVQGLEQSTLADAARTVGQAHHIEIAADPEPDRNSFVRTDQYSFVQAGIPALAMKFGWDPGSPEYRAWRAWLAERYHSTDDDLDQPVDLVAAAQFNVFFADLARQVANDSSRPHYLDTSFFKRFETGK